MNGIYDPFLEEIYDTRAKLLEKYGGMEGYSKHLQEQRPILEAQGWHFVTPEERAERIANQESTVSN
jgi:hypothetical protein